MSKTFFLFAAFLYLGHSLSGAPSTSSVGSTVISPKTSLRSIVKKVSTAVVDLYAIHIQEYVVNPFSGDPLFDSFFKNFFDLPYDHRQKERHQGVTMSSGSGVIIDPKGIIVTCAHVVRGATKVRAQLNDGRRFHAKILSVDEENDIAFLQIEKIENAGERLPFLEIGNSDTLEPGDPVFAIGNSFGLGQSVTQGIISATQRAFGKTVVVQTDASVNPGNSGGGLINMEGKLVGLPNAILSKTGASHGVGFAIPSRLISVILMELRGQHKPSNFSIGLQELTWELTDALNESMKGKKESTLKNGVLVSFVDKNSPKELKIRDVIVAINGKSVHTPQDVAFRARLTNAGSDVTMRVWREGSFLDLSFKSQGLPSMEAVNLPSGPFFSKMRVVELKGGVGVQGFPSSWTAPDKWEGILVMEVRSSMLPIQKGDIIIGVNGVKVDNTKELMKQFKASQNEGSIVLDLIREKQHIRFERRTPSIKKSSVHDLFGFF